jgi:hypothetical protein
MKKITFLFMLSIWGSIAAYSQSKNNLTVVYGFAANSMYSSNQKADGGYQDGNSNLFGLTYTRQVNRVLGFETGVVYSINHMQYNSFQPGIAQPSQNADLGLLTIPFITRATFWKYFFADAGFTLDFETSNSMVAQAKQTGLGYQLGIGAQVNMGKISLLVSPFLQQHAVALFSGRTPYSLLNAGIMFGVGYNF